MQAETNDATELTSESPSGDPPISEAPVSGPLIELPRFTGPLDLLLSLVEQRRLPITEISLAQVADQYLGYLATLDEPDRDLLARFVSIGGRLLLLKSRMLLPRENVTAADEAESAEDLVRALEEFRIIRRAVEWLEDRAERPAFPHGLQGPGASVMAPLAPPSPAELERALRRLFNRRPPELPTETGSPVLARITVAARLTALRSVLLERSEIDWADVAGTTVDSIVATFLAVLELIRRGEVSITQEDTFGPIRIFALRENGAIVTDESAVSPDAEYS